MAGESASSRLQEAAQQQQFLDVIDRDEAALRFRRHLRREPLGVETIELSRSLNRVLAEPIASKVDVPGFDRSNVDGFAVQAADTFGADEESPRLLSLASEVISPGNAPTGMVSPGSAIAIATGGMVPRGADAVVMVEHTNVDASTNSPRLAIHRPVTPGSAVTYAGSDIAKGETIARAGQLLTSREIGVLAAVGTAKVVVYRRPRVAIISTGDEIVAPGESLPTGAVYDSNAAILSAAVIELGGEPVDFGVIPDEVDQLRATVHAALECDVVVLSGGTSKGAGDVSYRVIAELDNPGIVAHGVALKPGKPICLAVTQGKPVVVLPGFPTSAIFTFHEFVAPVIRDLAGRHEEQRETVPAQVPMRINSERGRMEFLLVGLVQGPGGLVAYPMGKGSGSVTTFSCADGFITIDQQTEIVEDGVVVDVKLFGRNLELADFVCIGSHCIGLDVLLSELMHQGLATKVMHVGSMAGLAAVKRGECDVAGIHLLDPETGQYNRPFLTEELELILGYRRMQGIVFRGDDQRFLNSSVKQALQTAIDDTECTMVNRNNGSGTRIIIDGLLNGARPPGYQVQSSSHNAVAAAVAQRRADWGIAIETVAKQYQLEFLPVREEHYDFVVRKDRIDRPPVQRFRDVLQDESARKKLVELGFAF